MTIFQDVETKGFPIEDIIPYEEPADGEEGKAHVVNPPANLHIFRHPEMSARDIVDIARATGQEVKALCGYIFVPKHNPDKLPACDRCMEIAGDIIREDG